MEITFKCANCDQELAVELSGAGSEIECPTCATHLIVPTPEEDEAETGAPEVEAAPIPAPGHDSPHIEVNAIADSAAAKEHKHFAVPVHEGPSEVLVKKTNKPLEVAVKESEKKMRIRCIRRIDCMEVGKDHFDAHVSAFLAKIGEKNVISMNTLTYTYIDIGSQKILTDYGAMITYRG